MSQRVKLSINLTWEIPSNILIQNYKNNNTTSKQFKIMLKKKTIMWTNPKIGVRKTIEKIPSALRHLSNLSKLISTINSQHSYLPVTEIHSRQDIMNKVTRNNYISRNIALTN